MPSSRTTSRTKSEEKESLESFFNINISITGFLVLNLWFLEGTYVQTRLEQVTFKK